MSEDDQTTTGGRIQLVGLTRRTKTTALDNLTLDIPAGSAFTLLGPSGSGNSAILQLIAGDDRADAGLIKLDGSDINRLKAGKRDVSVLTVDSGRRAADRPVTERLRRALDEALGNRSSVVLLDRPLAGLEPALREAAMRWLRTRHDEAGSTFIYATGDAEEALALSDRIAVLRDGHLLQAGPTHEVYFAPASTFVATLLGPANLLPVEVVSGGSRLRVAEVRLGEVVLSVKNAAPEGAGDLRLGIRPESVRLAPPDRSSLNHVPAVIERALFLGATTKVQLRLEAGPLIQVLLYGDHHGVPLDQGTPVSAYLPPDSLRLLPHDG